MGFFFAVATSFLFYICKSVDSRKCLGPDKEILYLKWDFMADYCGVKMKITIVKVWDLVEYNIFSNSNPTMGLALRLNFYLQLLPSTFCNVSCFLG